ncbi:MAG TPA: ferredoxin [Pyrinomonadaceae bacterium]|nr:ferredoxin [Pyrinomonadaceae bacterium]
MDEWPKKHSLNVQGRYYVTEACAACEACQDAAPNIFRLGEEALTYIFKQPATPEEEQLCRQALLDCPMGAIRDDG